MWVRLLAALPWWVMNPLAEVLAWLAWRVVRVEQAPLRANLTASFPATAARGVGFGDVPLLCASEINVPGSMPLTVRVLMHAYTERAREELRHVYLRKAPSLRDDLPE